MSFFLGSRSVPVWCGFKVSTKILDWWFCFIRFIVYFLTRLGTPDVNRSLQDQRKTMALRVHLLLLLILLLKL